jgi:alkyl hydroperoxide reductase subunit F
MALDSDVKSQLLSYLDLLEQPIILKLCVGLDEASSSVADFVNEVAAMSPKISVQPATLERTPSFAVDRADYTSGIVFAGLPLGHEFTSFVLALLQVSGRKPKIDDALIRQIQTISSKSDFVTYVSLSCHNCPEVVQSLNIMSVLNPNISNTMVDGANFRDEVEAKQIMAIPTVYLNGQEFGGGRMTVEQILEKMGKAVDDNSLHSKAPFDVLVIGGGPAGSAAAIYAARKGIRTGLLSQTMGGQVLETSGIENIIGIQHTEGPKYMANVAEHIQQYDVDVISNKRALKIEKKDLIEVTVEGAAVLRSKTVVIATGAKWRSINVPGEQELKSKGIAHCPHCDGPIFAKKDIAVIGGTPKVESITYSNRDTGADTTIKIEGVFILIGLMPNTDWLKDGPVELTNRGEIIVDKHGATNVPGIFAGGDCTDSIYKQIVISLGSGATAALGAFDYLIRNT